MNTLGEHIGDEETTQQVRIEIDEKGKLIVTDAMVDQLRAANPGKFGAISKENIDSQEAEPNKKFLISVSGTQLSGVGGSYYYAWGDLVRNALNDAENF